MTNVVITASDADNARVRSKGLSVMANGMTGTVIYEDLVTRTADGWRIAARNVLPARTEPAT